MGFRLVPTSMTLNAVIALILCFSPNSMALETDYVTVVEDKTYNVSEFQSSTFGHN